MIHTMIFFDMKNIHIKNIDLLDKSLYESIPAALRSAYSRDMFDASGPAAAALESGSGPPASILGYY